MTVWIILLTMGGGGKRDSRFFSSQIKNAGPDEDGSGVGVGGDCGDNLGDLAITVVIGV